MHDIRFPWADDYRKHRYQGEVHGQIHMNMKKGTRSREKTMQERNLEFAMQLEDLMNMYGVTSINVILDKD